MNETDLPLFPRNSAPGPDVCERVRVYLGVWDELTPAQIEVVDTHLRRCTACTAVLRSMQQVTQLITLLEPSVPSAHVDQAVMAAIAARNAVQLSQSPLLPPAQGRPARRQPSRRLMGSLALAAALVLLLAAAFVALMKPFDSSTSFALPKSLKWSDYVLYYTETHVNAQGERYHISAYHDLSNGQMHVETVMDDKLDVVAVGDTHEMLGIDEMHHIAQWDAHEWGVDVSAFDLAQLRHELETGSATYTGKDRYEGQDVYHIRRANGLVLLLDMHYMPVNVLQKTGLPTYEKLQFLPPTQVSNTIWDMRIPPGYQIGTLPPKP